MQAKRKKGPRATLWRQQAGACYYCGKATRLPVSGQTQQYHDTATLDHIVPLSKRGVFAPTQNCVVACRQCNVERGKTDARLFLLRKQGAM